MSVADNKIITVQKMCDATVEAKEVRRRATVAANIQIPSPSRSFSALQPSSAPPASSIDFGRGRGRRRRRAVSFYFIGVQ